MGMIGSVCPLPIAYNPFTRQRVHLLYFDPWCKTALTGIKTDGTICEYDINPLRQLNLSLNPEETGRIGIKTVAQPEHENTEHLRTDRWSN